MMLSRISEDILDRVGVTVCPQELNVLSQEVLVGAIHINEVTVSSSNGEGYPSSY